MEINQVKPLWTMKRAIKVMAPVFGLVSSIILSSQLPNFCLHWSYFGYFYFLEYDMCTFHCAVLPSWGALGIIHIEEMIARQQCVPTQRTQLLILEGGWRSGIFEKTMKPPSFSHVIFFWILLSTAFIFQQISKVCTTFESWDTILPGPSGFGTPAALKNLFI